MFTTRNIVLFALIMLVSIATNWVVERGDEQDEPHAIGRNDPDLYMLNARITQFSAKGARQHEIRASRLTHFPLTNMTALITPNVSLFASNASSPWNITADNGRLLPQSQLRDQIVELWDNVLATRSNSAGDFINIQTASLTVYPGQDYAETNQKVYIDGARGRTSAAGMQAYLEEGRYLFSSDSNNRVITTLWPAAKHP